MTTYQDPPLQSRRAARQNERADAIQPQYPDASSAPLPPAPAAPIDPLTTPESLLYSTQARSVPEYDAQSFRGRRVAETPEDASPRTEAGYRVRDFSPEARRAALQTWSQPATTDGALTYQTQQRPPAPVEPAPATDWSAPVEPTPPTDWSAPVEPMPATDWSAPAEPTPAPVAEAAAPAPAPELGGGELPDHTLTRRELRAIREAQGLPPETGPGYTVPASSTSTAPPLVEPAPWTPEQYVGPVQYSTPSEQDATPATITSPSHYADPVAPSEATSTNDQFSAFEALFGSEQQPATAAPEQEFPTQYAHPLPTIPPAYVPVSEAPVFEAPVFEAPVFETPAAEAPVFETPVAEVPAREAPAFDALLFAAPVVEQLVEPAPVSEQPVYEQPAYQAPVDAVPEYEAPVTEVPVTTGERPVGHWSRQAELDDEVQFGSASISREVGMGVITTSALVLPEIPQDDFTRSLTSTGDVLLTGSIDLPRSLSSTGALPEQLDESSIDHLLDPGDRQVASTDSQPVRAVKAVSTHTSSRGIINAAPPKRGNKMLTTLIISASAMLVVVVGLAVVIVMSDVLK